MTERPGTAGLLPQSAVGRGVLLAVGWTIVGLIFALPNLRGEGVLLPLLRSLVQWWAWGLVTPLIVAVDRRLPFSDHQLAQRLGAHLALSPLITAIYIYVGGVVGAIAGLMDWSVLADPGFIVGALRGMFLWSWLVYWVIVGAWLALQYYERFVTSELRLERSFTEARLNALRLQLDPHFLFNALNTISSQVERDPRLARRMIEHLGDLLRLTLQAKNRQEVALSEELALLDHYLAIQRIRFGDHLALETEISPAARHAAVPSLILQPLVENAVRHGLASRASGGTVRVSADATSGRLELRVQDDGVGLPPGWRLDTDAGTGLSITRDRIATLHPNGSSRFAVVPRPAGGTAVEISLPFRLLDEAGA